MCGIIYVRESKFVLNSAESSGGVLFTTNYIRNSTVTVQKSSFHNNSAVKHGRVIALITNSVLALSENVFTYNYAKTGILHFDTGNKLIIENSTFSYNSATDDGGVIFSRNHNILRINTSSLTCNRASNSGGVFFFH